MKHLKHSTGCQQKETSHSPRQSSQKFGIETQSQYPCCMFPCRMLPAKFAHLWGGGIINDDWLTCLPRLIGVVVVCHPLLSSRSIARAGRLILTHHRRLLVLGSPSRVTLNVLGVPDRVLLLLPIALLKTLCRETSY